MKVSSSHQIENYIKDTERSLMMLLTPSPSELKYQGEEKYQSHELAQENITGNN